MPRELRPFVIAAVALVLAALALEVVNGRFWLSDFRVYWSAAEAMVHEQPVYGVAFGEDTGFYKYAPVVAMAFVPASLLPFSIAAIIHFLLIGVALVIVVLELERLLMRHMLLAYAPHILLRTLLLLLCIAVLLSRELHLGNINLWLVVGVVIATRDLLDGSLTRAGLLFGALWLAKPYLALMVIPLLVRRQWSVLASAGGMMLVGILVPFVVLGPTKGFCLHAQWVQAMSAHSAYLTSPDTLSALLGSLYVPIPAWVFIGVVALVLSTVGWTRSGSSPMHAERSLCVALWTAFAVVPNLVVTDQEHFLFSIPLIAFVLAALFRRNDRIVLSLFVIAMLLYATRSSDLWGSPLENTMAAAGALGLGNVLLLLSAWIAHERSSGPQHSGK